MQNIALIQSLDVYIFSLFLLLLVGVKSLNSPGGRTPQARAFSILLALTFLIIVADCVTVLFDGYPGAAMRFALVTACLFGYSLQVLICLCWFWYARAVVFRERKLLGRTAVLQGLPAILCLLVAAVSFRTGWFFSYDDANIYHRGPLFALIATVSYLYLALGYFMIIRFRKNLDRRHFIALLCFALPPSAGGLIQTFLYGVTLLWPCMTISLLIIYMAIQNDLLLLDYLTGINNRRSFDYALRRRVASARNGTPFALLLIDLDNFKSVNDRLGHRECDEILKTFAEILNECFRRSGFVARYGGDEFAAIVEMEDIDGAGAIKERLQSRLDEWNARSGKPWKLSVSMGCAPYLPSAKVNQDVFLMQVDKLLSLDKIIPGSHRFGRRRDR
jgi:diguanylate cyclase (GGDEF)-like protein